MSGVVNKKTKKISKNFRYSSVLPKLADMVLESTDRKVIQKIYLFGSYAYGRPTKKSDIDIAIILDNVDNRTDYRQDISIMFFDKKIDNDLLVYRANDFYSSTNPESVENTIIEKGILLYERPKDWPDTVALKEEQEFRVIFEFPIGGDAL